MLTLSLSALVEADTIYVDDDSTCTSSCGGTWNTAYPDLQDALAAASSGDVIRVAQGTYYPTSCVTCTAIYRSETFHLVENVDMYGGYAGIGMADPDERSIQSYESILSGDIDSSGDNDSYHVVTGGNGITTGTLVDGFTIAQGKATGSGDDQYGGGILLNGFVGGTPNEPSGSPTLANCTIEHNESSHSGGAVHAQRESEAQFNNCTFQNNETFDTGGAVLTSQAAPDFTDCVFISNETTATSGNHGTGGAVAIGTSQHFDSESVEFTRCIFKYNTATKWGGAIRTHTALMGEPVLKNCLFFHNVAGTGAGGGLGGAIYTEMVITIINWVLPQNLW